MMNFSFSHIGCLLLIIVTLSGHTATHEVIVQDNNFSPANISIEAGDSVRWINMGNNNHNVSSTTLDYIFRCANGCDDTGGSGMAAANAWQTTVTFHQPASSIPYVCEPHEGFGMTGSVSVQMPAEFISIGVDETNGFVPNQLTINQHQRVFFHNISGAHNVAEDNLTFRCADGCEDDGIEGIETYTGFPWSFYYQFNQPGTFSIHCENPAHTETAVIEVLEMPIFVNGFETN